MICTQSLYSQWKEEKLVIKSLEELNNVINSFIIVLPIAKTSQEAILQEDLISLKFPMKMDYSS